MSICALPRRSFQPRPPDPDKRCCPDILSAAASVFPDRPSCFRASGIATRVGVDPCVRYRCRGFEVARILADGLLGSLGRQLHPYRVGNPYCAMPDLDMQAVPRPGRGRQMFARAAGRQQTDDKAQNQRSHTISIWIGSPRSEAVLSMS